MILSEDISEKSSLTVLAVKYLFRILLNSVQVMRKCLTVKGSLQDIQKGGCSLMSKYVCVNLVCPILHLVILVWFCLL